MSAQGLRSTRFLFVRHAQSEGNAAGLWQGQWDPPLSALGRDQARALAREMEPESLDAIVASDLKRAWETAAIVAEHLGVDAEPEPRLRELDVGRWSGLPHEEIARRHPDELARFRAGDEALRPGGGESRALVRRRISAALEAVTRERDHRVAIVTHLGVLRLIVPGIALANTGTLWMPADEAVRAAGGAPGDGDAPALEGPL